MVIFQFAMLVITRGYPCMGSSHRYFMGIFPWVNFWSSRFVLGTGSDAVYLHNFVYFGFTINIFKQRLTLETRFGHHLKTIRLSRFTPQIDMTFPNSLGQAEPGRSLGGFCGLAKGSRVEGSGLPWDPPQKSYTNGAAKLVSTLVIHIHIYIYIYIYIYTYTYIYTYIYSTEPSIWGVNRSEMLWKAGFCVLPGRVALPAQDLDWPTGVWDLVWIQRVGFPKMGVPQIIPN